MAPSEASESGQRWIAERYAANARFVADLGEPLIDLLAPTPGERILDLGCGDGALTEKLLSVDITRVAVDAASDQVAATRARGLDARVADGYSLPFDTEFDGILSNAALHWMSDDPNAVIAGMWRALKPGGRIAAEMGGAGNIASITRALGDALSRRGIDAASLFPWYFPAAETYSSQLKDAGFSVPYIELIPRPTELPGDISGWLVTFAEPFLFSVTVEERDALIEEVADELRPVLVKDGRWIADYVRLRFLAEKPE